MLPDGPGLSHVAAKFDIFTETRQDQQAAYNQVQEELTTSFREEFPNIIDDVSTYMHYYNKFFEIQAAQYNTLKLQVQSQLDRLKD